MRTMLIAIAVLLIATPAVADDPPGPPSTPTDECVGIRLPGAGCVDGCFVGGICDLPYKP